MRGKDFYPNFHPLGLGITPAYAGKSSDLVLLSHEITGSPPHMRGKVAGLLATDIVDGITPAYAGKSCHYRCLPCRQRDHPRICGEKCS